MQFALDKEYVFAKEQISASTFVCFYDIIAASFFRKLCWYLKNSARTIFFRQSPKRASQSYKVSITGISKVNCKWMGSNTSQIIWCNLYSISYSNLHDLKLLCVWLSILYCLSSCYHVQEGERKVNIIRQFEQFYSVQTILPHQQYLFSSM